MPKAFFYKIRTETKESVIYGTDLKIYDKINRVMSASEECP